MGLMAKQITYTGELRWEVRLDYEGRELDEARRLTGIAQIAPEVVYLVWTRRIGEPWRRVPAYRDGSRIEGRERLSFHAERMGAVGRWGFREIFTRSGSELKDWADRYPGLRNAIEAAEADLPPCNDQVNPPLGS